MTFTEAIALMKKGKYVRRDFSKFRMEERLETRTDGNGRKYYVAVSPHSERRYNVTDADRKATNWYTFEYK